MKQLETKDKYIRKQPNGTFSVRVPARIGGKILSRKKANILSIGEARRIQSDFVIELETKKKHFKQGGLWGQALEEYLKLVGQRGSPKTFEDVQTALRHHSKSWMNYPLAEVKPADIIDMFDGSLKNAKPATKKKVVGYISRVFDHFIKAGRIYFNPASSVKFPTKAKGQEKLIAMNREEITLLLKRAKELKHEWYFNWYLAYQTGMRSGELYALEWRQIDFKNKLIIIDQAYSKGNSASSTKNKKSRAVSINEGTLRFLIELQKVSGRDRFVLQRNRDWERGKAAAILRSFQADIGVSQTNFHSIRASFITHLLLAGTPVTKVKEMVGHAELKTTERYVRLCGSDVKGATTGIDMETLALPAGI